MIVDEVVADLNVLRLVVLHRVWEIWIALTLSHRRGTLSKLTPKSFKCCLIHNSWAQQLAAAIYSDSAVDIDTQFCFLDDQHTKDLPRNWQVPEVDFLPTLSPA